ncbi:MAG: RNA polymerase sigma factor [Anaerolineales bacterium]|nr:RNA polymerase sigma factor [Anaerolineales bacterium]
MSSIYTTQTLSPPVDDAVLANRAVIDSSAFAELYHRHFDRVYRYHIAHTGNVNDAQDLTAQTFIAALEGIANFRGDGSFCAWLLGIARNKMALHFRSRRSEISLANAENIPDKSPSPEENSYQKYQLTLISRALRQIKSERAEALELCIFGDLTAAEAGLILGKSEAATKMLVCRGLKDLRQKCSLLLLEEK